MSDGINISGPVAFMSSSKSSVFFTQSTGSDGTFETQAGSSTQVKKAMTALNVAYWGEDNRFPQNIEQQMASCGSGRAGLDWKARALYGGGIVPGRIVDADDGSDTEKFVPLKRDEGKEVYAFMENRRMFRFWLEYLQDWSWFKNTFPEMILSKDGSKITHFVHQESCDCRFKQMNDQGIFETVYLSKLWGKSDDQFAKFDPKAKILGLPANPRAITELDGKLIKAIDCIDMYDPVESLRKIAKRQVKNRKANALKSAILPVNYPSPNKTYYQVADWDAARRAGWIEIAAKIPALIKTLYNKAFRIKYHIEIPESYFEKKYTPEKWKEIGVEGQKGAKLELLKEMDDYLTNQENAFSTFVSFFDVDRHEKLEYGRIKINKIDEKNEIDKDLISASAADLQISAAIGVHPTISGIGAMASGAQRTGGSDQREAFLIYMAQLNLERQVLLEPLYLARDFNGWDPTIVFRFRDTKLTTLDKNKGTEKVLS